MPGIRTCRAWAVVPGNLHPENNTKTDTFKVKGTVLKDAAVRAVLAPTGVIDTGQSVTPEARYANKGIAVASFWTYFSILDSGGVAVYAESLPATVPPGDSTDMEYPEVEFAAFGTYTAACSVAMDGDQNVTNDTKLDTFDVGSVGAADGSFIVLRPSFIVAPNPATSGFLVLSFTGPLDHVTTGPLSLSIFDPSGRQVLESPIAIGLGGPCPTVRQSPIALDLRTVPAGVYMLRVAAGTNTYSQKVVLQH